MSARSVLSRFSAGAFVVAAVFALAACAPSEPDDAPAPVEQSETPGEAVAGSTETAAPAPVSTPTEAPAAFLPEGTAEQNLPIFRAVIDQVAASEQKTQGRAYIDALVAAGFTDKASMQLTPDVTTIGNAAESIMFSVLWQGQCLIGQVGPATGDPVAAVQAPVGTGLCLLGTTRPIDW